MTNLTSRSYTKELLDHADIPFKDIRQNMKELNTINTFLGGHKISIAGIKELLAGTRADRPIVICEIGCGGGDNLHAIERYCKGHKIQAHYIGIDIKPECIAFARQQYPGMNADWITNDYQNLGFTNRKPDIIFSSLFCHHFTEAELISMMQWMKENSGTGFFVNDLHRHPLAYYSIKILTRLFSGSYLVKNDAPLSVARGFTRKEWESVLQNAGIKNYSISWKWAFRHLVIYKNE